MEIYQDALRNIRGWKTMGKKFEGWLLKEAGFELVFSISQMFVKPGSNGRITMLMLKVTDDLLIAGPPTEIENFIKHISRRFPISKAIFDDDIKFNGSNITQLLEGKIILSMEQYMRDMIPVDISPERKNHRMEPETESEKKNFRSLAGEFVWIGTISIPHASYIGSWMQQKVPMLIVDDLVQENGILKEMNADITFIPPHDEVENMVATSFSDAVFNVKRSSQ